METGWDSLKRTLIINVLNANFTGGPAQPVRARGPQLRSTTSTLSLNFMQRKRD